MTPEQMEGRIVRYENLVTCRMAFIDANAPGSDQKENLTIAGDASEGHSQFVHVEENPGFTIGSAGLSPGCVNSLHKHHTAQAFFVLKGRWRFFWGRYGNSGEVVLEEGDFINLPAPIFRSFENIGSQYGTIMSVLGGDAAGQVTWAPEVIENAIEHGLVLGEDNQLYDAKYGEYLPEGMQPMPPIAQSEIDKLIDPSSREIVTRCVARYWDLMALSDREPVNVISADGLIKDKPGFKIDFISGSSMTGDMYSTERHETLMVMRGYWRLAWGRGAKVLAPGDVCAIPPGLEHSLIPAMDGEASLYRVTSVG